MMLTLRRYALSVSVAAAAMLAGCGGSQPPIGAPGATTPSEAYTQTSRAHNAGRPRAAVEFAYVANDGSNNVSAYGINASTGALTQLTGSPFAAGYMPSAVAIDPTGKFAYAVNNGSISGKYPGNVSAYAINARAGALTQVKGSPFAAGDGPTGMAIDPTAKFAYVTNYGSGDVSAYAINARTGALKQVHGSPFKISPRAVPTAVAVDPVGSFAYVTDYGKAYPYQIGRVYAFAIDARTGALTRIKGSPFEAGYGPDSLAIDRAGKFVYVTNYSGDVSGYAINANTGFLTQVPGSPFRAGNYASGVAIDPDGKFAYVPSAFQVFAYAIDARSGELALREKASAPGTVDAVAIDSAGKFAYVPAADDGVSAYTIDASSGMLTPVSGSPFSAGGGPDGVATCRVVGNACLPPPL